MKKLTSHPVVKTLASFFVVLLLLSLSSAQQSEQSKPALPTFASLVGVNVYACGHSRLWPLNSESPKLDWGPQAFNQYQFPRLEPLPITAVHNMGLADGMYSVALVLDMKAKGKAVAVATLLEKEGRLQGQPLLDRLVHGGMSLLMAHIPKEFTPDHIQLIKTYQVVPGMTSHEARCALGNDIDAENDWGRGGTQLVVGHGRTIVYINNSGRVVDVQRLDSSR